MSGKTEKMHRKMSLVTYGSSKFARQLKRVWDTLNHREKGRVRKKVDAAITAWERAQLENVIEGSIAGQPERKF